jgi:mitochondrial fission process protein 1
MFDKPVEEAVEWGFYTAFRAIGGENAVGKRPHTGRSEALQIEAKAAQEKKDL